MTDFFDAQSNIKSADLSRSSRDPPEWLDQQVQPHIIISTYQLQWQRELLDEFIRMIMSESNLNIRRWDFDFLKCAPRHNPPGRVLYPALPRRVLVSRLSYRSVLVKHQKLLELLYLLDFSTLPV